MAASPWLSMEQQAQAVSSPTDPMSATGAELMQSQLSPQNMELLDDDTVQNAVASGADPSQFIPVDPAKLQRSVARTAKIQAKGPMSQEAVTPEVRNQDILAKYSALADKAINEQQAGIDQLGDQIKQAGALPQGLNFVPLAAMAKFLNPENDFVKEAQMMAPPTPEARADKLLGLQDMLQKRKESLTKSQLDSLAEQIKAAKAGPGSLAEMAMLSKIRKDNALADVMMKRPEMQRMGLDTNTHNKVITAVDNNPMLRTQLQQLNGLGNSWKMISEAKEVTPQLFQEYQQAVAGAIQRGNSGVAERQERYLKSLGITKDDIQQYATGKPVDIGKQHPMLVAMKHFADIEAGNIEKQRNALLKTVTSGHESMYARRPDLKADLESKIAASQNLAANAGSGAEASGGLTEAEKAELANLEQKFGGK